MEIERCESHLSTLPRKLGSGKTRRIGNMKEESTPYDGADSLKQIRVLSTFQFTRFQLTELFACSCLQDILALSATAVTAAAIPTRKSKKNCVNLQTFGKNSCGLLHISHERDTHPNVPSFMILSTKLHHRCDKWRHSTKKVV